MKKRGKLCLRAAYAAYYQGDVIHVGGCTGQKRVQVKVKCAIFLPENRITVAISSLALLFLLLKMTHGLIVDRAL